MNRVYKVIWSKAKHCYVVTSEIARSVTKSASSARSAGRKGAAVLAMAALLFTAGGVLGEAANVTEIAVNKRGNVITATKDVGEPTSITIDNVDHAKRAVKATKDGDGNVISTTYVKNDDAKVGAEVTYVNAANTVGQNLSVLDAQVTKNTVAVLKVATQVGENTTALGKLDQKVKDNLKVGDDGVISKVTGDDSTPSSPVNKLVLNVDGNNRITMDEKGIKVGTNSTVIASDGVFAGGDTAADAKAALNANGSIKGASGKFTVDGATGNVEAYGTLNAANGKFSVGNDGQLGVSNGSFKVDTDGGIYASNGSFKVDTNGGINIGNGTATIDNNGNITGKKLDVGTGDIKGGKITGAELDVGTGNIKGGQITGAELDVGTGNIKGGQITGTGLDVGAGTINTTGTVKAGDVQTGTLTTTGKAEIGGDLTAGDTTVKSLDAGSGLIKTTGGISGTNITGDNVEVNNKLTTKDMEVKGEFKVSGEFKTEHITLGSKPDNYTEIDKGNVTSEVNDTDGGVKYTAESIFNKDGSSITARTDEGIVDSTGKSIVGAKEISQYLGDNAKPEGSQKNVTRKMVRNNDGTFSMEDKAVVEGKSSTVSQNAEERKVTVIDGNNKASTNLSNKGFNTYASDGKNETYTKQTATDIKNTAEKGMISHTAKNLVNTASENMTNTVDKDLTTTVGGNETRTVKGTLTETVTGNVTEDYKADLSTKVGGNETHAVTGNQTVTVSKDRTVNVKGTETENFNAQVTNVKTDQQTSVGGNQTNIVTGNQQNTVSGSKTETVKGAVTEKYGSQATTVDGDQSTTVTGKQTNSITGDQVNTIGGKQTTTVTGDSSLSAKNITNTASEKITNQIGNGSAVKSEMTANGITNTAKEGTIYNKSKDILNEASGDIINWADGEIGNVATKITNITGDNTVTSDTNGTTFENKAHNTAVKEGTVTKTTISGNTIETGQATMDYADVTKDLSVGGNATVEKDFTVKGASEFVGRADFRYDVYVDNNLTVAKETRTDTLYVDHDGYVGGNLNVDGNIETHDAVLSADSRQVVTGRQLYQTNERVDRLDNRIKKVGANAAALAALRPGDFNPDDKFSIAAGFGSYRNANAAALGLFYRPNENVLLSLGTSFGDGENMVNAGVSVKFGRGKSMAERRKEMADEVSSMRDEMRSQDERIAELEEMLKKQSELIEKLSKES